MRLSELAKECGCSVMDAWNILVSVSPDGDGKQAYIGEESNPFSAKVPEHLVAQAREELLKSLAESVVDHVKEHGAQAILEAVEDPVGALATQAGTHYKHPELSIEPWEAPEDPQLSSGS